MNKFVSGLAVVALLLTPLAITSPAQAVTLKVHREYGQGPVTIPAGVDRVEIVFHGRKGNTVRVDEPCDKVTLRGPSGRVARWLGGAWRLPAPGRYSFVLTGCKAQSQTSAQLTKIRLRPLPVDGDAPGVVVPQLAGRTRTGPPWSSLGAAACRSGRRRRRSGGAVVRLVPRGRTRCSTSRTGTRSTNVPRRPIYLEAGAPVANELGTMAPYRANRSCHERDNESSSCPARAGSAPAPPGPARCPARSTARRWRWLPSGATRRSACGSPPRATSG